MQNTTANTIPCATITVLRSGVIQYRVLLDSDQWADLGYIDEIDLDLYTGKIEKALMNLKHIGMVQ